MQACVSLAVVTALLAGFGAPPTLPPPPANARPNTRPLDRSTPRAIVDPSMQPQAKRPPAKAERPRVSPPPRVAPEPATTPEPPPLTPVPTPVPAPIVVPEPLPPPPRLEAPAVIEARDTVAPPTDARCMTPGLRCRAVSAAGFSVGSLGFAAVATGIAFVAIPDRVIPEQPVSLRSYELPGIVTIGVGGAALLTGIALVITSHALHRRAAQRGQSW